RDLRAGAGEQIGPDFRIVAAEYIEHFAIAIKIYIDLAFLFSRFEGGVPRRWPRRISAWRARGEQQHAKSQRYPVPHPQTDYSLHAMLRDERSACTISQLDRWSI